MTRTKKLFSLFKEFFQFGCFTFGGGWGIVAQMKELYVNKKNTITDERLLDLTSVGRSIPGIMIGNIAALFGYEEAGIAGALACILGMSIPPVAVLILISQFYRLFRENIWISCALNGIRAAVVPVVLSALVGMLKSAFPMKPCFAVALLTLTLYLVWGVNCVWLVLIGAASGFLICEINERRGAKSK